MIKTSLCLSAGLIASMALGGCTVNTAPPAAATPSTVVVQPSAPAAPPSVVVQPNSY